MPLKSNRVIQMAAVASKLMELGENSRVLLQKPSRYNYSHHTVFSPNEPLTLRHINEAPHS